MGKKERSFDPNQAHRKEQKKAEAKKLKKQRDERKEAQYKADPTQIDKELQRLKHLDEFRAEAGSNAKRTKKIEELTAVKKEAERRRAEDAAQQAQFAPPPSLGGGDGGGGGGLDMSAITGRKRKAEPPRPNDATSADAHSLDCLQ